MSLVILDANSIIRDFRLRTPATRFLLRRCRDGTDVVVVPSVALREAVAVYERQYRKQIDSIESAFKGLDRLRSDLEDYEPLWEQELADLDNYEAWLHEQLAETGVVVRDPPEATMELVDRATKRLPPFDSKGQNFRDALIWLTIMDILREEMPTGTVSFVSADQAAFWNEDSLHPRLKAEFEGLNLAGTQFLLFRSISDYVRVQVTDEVTIHLEVGDFIEEELHQILAVLEHLLTDQFLDIADAYGDGVITGLSRAVDPTLIVDHVGLIEGQAEYLVSMTLQTDLTVEVNGFDPHFDAHLGGDWVISRAIPVIGLWLPQDRELINLTIGPIDALGTAGGYVV